LGVTDIAIRSQLKVDLRRHAADERSALLGLSSSIDAAIAGVGIVFHLHGSVVSGAIHNLSSFADIAIGGHLEDVPRCVAVNERGAELGLAVSNVAAGVGLVFNLQGSAVSGATHNLLSFADIAIGGHLEVDPCCVAVDVRGVERGLALSNVAATAGVDC
jgi:hypothetical protein